MVSGLGTCTRGVDVSDYVSSSHLSCLKQNGYQFVIVRAYQSLCRVDPYAVRTLANAKAMGLLADVYMFPSPRCSKSASTQVKEMGEFHSHTRHSKLSEYCFSIPIVYALRNASYGQIWLDIEVGRLRVAKLSEYPALLALFRVHNIGRGVHQQTKHSSMSSCQLLL